MGTKVKIEQVFEETLGRAPEAFLKGVQVGPLTASIAKGNAGQYDTTDDVRTCVAFPRLPTLGAPRVRRLPEIYSDPVMINAKLPDLVADAETNLSRIQDNINAYLDFREGPEDRIELAESGGGLAPNEIFECFHTGLTPGSIVIARKTTISKTIAADVGGDPGTTWLDSADFPLTNDTPTVGTIRADGIVPNTITAHVDGSPSLVRVPGVDFTLEYDFDGSGGGTKWALKRVEGGLLSPGDVLEITFEAKFAFKFGTGEDFEVDYVNGTIQSNLGANDEIDDAIIYYGFSPVVSVAAFLQERVTGNITQLDATDYTVRTIGGVDMVCLRSGLQGAIMSGDSLEVTATEKYGNGVCGTKSEEFVVAGPCGEIESCTTLYLCANNDGVTTTFDVVLGSDPPGDDNGDGTFDYHASDIATQLNANATFAKFLVAYANSSGQVCIRLRTSRDGDTIDASHIDMAGAENYVDILGGDSNGGDITPLLGLPHGRICGRTQYEITSAGSSFQTQQDALANLLGSVLIDGSTSERRYIIDQVIDDTRIIVSQVDSEGNLICGNPLVVSPNTGAWNIYYSGYSGEILVSYAAVRGDLGDELIVIENDDDIVAKLSLAGDGVDFSKGPDNPLAYAASKALLNTRQSFFVLPVKTDDEAGYDSAIEILEVEPEIWLINPLTYDENIHAKVAAHVMDVSDPDNVFDPMARVGLYQALREPAKVVGDLANDNAEIRFSENPASRTYSSTTVDPTNATEYTTNGRAKIFRLVEGTEETVNFVSDGVKPGDLVRIHSGANAGEHKVVRLVTTLGGTRSNELELTPVDPDEWFVWDTLHGENADPSSPTGTNQNGHVSYTIYRTLSKTEFRDEIKGLSTPFLGYKYNYRSVVTWGPLAVDNATPDGRTAVVPSYFVNAALLGARMSTPVNQGMTNYPIAGFDDILYTKGLGSNTRSGFKDSILAEIEAAGIWIWARPRRSESVISLEQVTVAAATATANTAGQFHIVAIADKYGRRLWQVLINYTGLYNIVEQNIPIFRTAIRSVQKSMMATSFPRVGPEIVDARTDDIACSKTTPRFLEVDTTIWVPEALDGFKVRNFVRRSLLRQAAA